MIYILGAMERRSFKAEKDGHASKDYPNSLI